MEKQREQTHGHGEKARESGLYGKSNMITYIAAAKSLQLCLTLCDPRDSSPPGFPVPGILQVTRGLKTNKQTKLLTGP